MANVNLNNLLKRPSNPNSSINYIYQDFNTMSMETLLGNNLGAKKVKSDLNVSYDIQAVKNSVSNILTTKKNQKILAPELGLRLEDFLFEPVSDTIAKLIANQIREALNRFEPRIKIESLQVNPFYDEQQYIINMVLRVPSLKTSIVLKGNIQNDIVTIQ